MASLPYLTSDTLIDAIKRESLLPSNQSTFSDDDFLAIANQEIKISMMPSIMIYHEEYYVRDSDDISLTANKSNYAIPYRAVGGKFREVFYKTSDNQITKMSRINPDDRPYYQQTNDLNNFNYFYIKGNDVVLVPAVGSSPTGSLVFSYYLRPNELVVEDRAGTITGISVGADETTYTLDNFPSALTSFTQDGVSLTAFSVNSKLDIMQRRPGHKTINFDVTPTAVNSGAKSVTFDNDDLDDSVIVGDIISFAGECIIPQIPSDLHEVLVQRVIQRCHQALGDAQGVTVASAKLSEMEKNTGILVDNRSEGSPTKISNLGSTLRYSKMRNRRSFN